MINFLDQITFTTIPTSAPKSAEPGESYVDVSFFVPLDGESEAPSLIMTMHTVPSNLVDEVVPICKDFLMAGFMN